MIMKRYLLAAMALLGASTMSLPANAQADYSAFCKWDEVAKKRGGTDRVVRTLPITGATKGGEAQTFTVEVAGANATAQTKINFDKTASVLQATKGDQLNVAPTFYNLHWTHFYLYIDYNQDGVFDEQTELVSYTHYRKNGTGDFKNSLGETIPKGDVFNGGKLPVFTIPESANTGLTYVRFKADWDNINPCGNPGATDGSNSLSANRGTICDFMINIHSKETPPVPADEFMVTVEYDTNKGEVEFEDVETGEKVDISKPIAKDTDLWVIVRAKENYEPISILVNDVEKIGEMEDTDFISVDIMEDTKIKVVFAPKTYEFKVQFDNTKVEVVTALDDDSPVGNRVEGGTRVYLFVNAKEGFELTSLKVNNKERLKDLDENHLIAVTVTENTTVVVEAQEAAAKAYTVTYSVKNNEGGTLSITNKSDGSEVKSGGKVQANETIVVKCVPAKGYKLSELLMNGVNFLAIAGNPEHTSFNVPVDTDYVIEAVFVKNTAVDGVDVAKAKVLAGEGAVIVEGVEAGTQVEVYTLAGKLVESVTAQGASHKVAVASGAYLVKVKSAVYKVQVK